MIRPAKPLSAKPPMSPAAIELGLGGADPQDPLSAAEIERKKRALQLQNQGMGASAQMLFSGANV